MGPTFARSYLRGLWRFEFLVFLKLIGVGEELQGRRGAGKGLDKCLPLHSCPFFPICSTSMGKKVAGQWKWWEKHDNKENKVVLPENSLAWPLPSWGEKDRTCHDGPFISGIWNVDLRWQMRPTTLWVMWSWSAEGEQPTALAAGLRLKCFSVCFWKWPSQPNQSLRWRTHF